MRTVGYAALQIIPSMKGTKRNIEASLNGTAASTGTKAGGVIGSRIGAAMKKTLQVAAVSAGALAGASLVKGFGRLRAIDDAQAKLRGLGHTGKALDGIMTNVKDSVTGTSFLIGDAAGVAGALLAANVKPGRELESTLKSVANAAAFAGTDMGSMGRIFAKVAETGKLQGDTLRQLSENDIPIVTLLSKTLGVSREEVYKLSSAGKIGFNDLRRAIDHGMGNAAAEQAKTFTGSLSNVWAAIGRAGENLLAPAFKAAIPLFNNLIPVLDRVGKSLQPVAEQFGNWLNRVMPQIVTGLDLTAKAFAAFVIALSTGEIEESGSAMIRTFQQIGLMARTGFGIAITVITRATAFIRDNWNWLKILLGAVVAGRAAWVIYAKAMRTVLTVKGTYVTAAAAVSKVTSGAARAMDAMHFAFKGTATAGRRANTQLYQNTVFARAYQKAMKGLASAQIVANVALSKASNGFKALGGIMRAHPIITIATIIAAAGAALTAFFTKTEAGRAALAAIKKALEPLGALISTVAGTLADLGKQLAPVLEPIAAALGTMGSEIAKSFAPLGKQFKQDLVPAFKDLGKALGEIGGLIGSLGKTIMTAAVPAVTTMVKEFAPVAGLILKSLAPAAAKVLGVFQTLAAALIPVIGKVAAVIGQLAAAIIPVVAQIIQAITPLVTFITDVVVVAIEALTPVVTAVTSAIVPIISAAMTVIQGIITTITGIITLDWSTAWDGIKLIAEGVWNLITGVIDGAINIIKSIIQAVLTTITGIWKSVWNGISGLARSIWNGITGIIRGAINGVAGVVRNVMGTIRGIWTGAWNGITGFARSIWNGITGIIRGAINGVAGVVRNVMGTIRGIWTAAWNGITGFLGGIWRGITTSVSNGIGKIAGFFRQLPGKILGALKGIPGQLKNVGVDMMKGMLGGIGSMAGALAKKAKDVVGGAVNGVKKFLRIKSPSRVFRDEIGVMMGRGLADGIDASIAPVQKATGRLINATIIEVTPQVNPPAYQDVPPEAFIPAPPPFPTPPRTDDNDRGYTAVINQNISTQDPEAAAQRAAALMRDGLQ